MMTPTQIWQATLGEFRLQLTKYNFETWLADAQLHSFEAGTNEFTIEVGDEFTKDWLENRLASAIRRTLTGICGRPASAIFIASKDDTHDEVEMDGPESAWEPDWAEFGIPTLFQGESLDTLDWSRPTLQKPELRDYLDHAVDYISTGMGLTLIGPPGTGKTHIAAALLKVAVLSGHSARFIGAVKLLDQLRATFDPSRQGGFVQTESRILRDLIGVHFLVLDDLRVDGLTVWGRDRLYALLNPRWEAQRPTLVTSNFTPNELAASSGRDRPGLDEGTLSRLVRSALTIQLAGEDYRLERKRQTLLTARARHAAQQPMTRHENQLLPEK